MCVCMCMCAYVRVCRLTPSKHFTADHPMSLLTNFGLSFRLNSNSSSKLIPSVFLIGGVAVYVETGRQRDRETERECVCVSVTLGAVKLRQQF